MRRSSISSCSPIQIPYRSADICPSPQGAPPGISPLLFWMLYRSCIPPCSIAVGAWLRKNVFRSPCRRDLRSDPVPPARIIAGCGDSRSCTDRRTNTPVSAPSYNLLPDYPSPGTSSDGIGIQPRISPSTSGSNRLVSSCQVVPAHVHISTRIGQRLLYCSSRM